MGMAINIGAKVRFPKRHNNPDETGEVVDIYTQPTINLDDDNYHGIIYLSDDEMPNPSGEYPARQLREKRLCVVRFPGCVHIVEYGKLEIVDD